MADLELMERFAHSRLTAIQSAAEVLLNMLNMADGPEYSVTRRQEQALWDNVKNETGYAAVNAFLETCAAMDGGKDEC